MPHFSLTLNNLFNLIFGLSGLVIMLTGLFQMLRAYLARSWPTATGTVLSAKVRKRGSTADRTFRPIIEYKYEVGSETFTSDKFCYGNWSTSWRQNESTEKIKEYAVGSVVTIHYNPRKPAEAVLETQAGIAWMLVVAGLLFLVGGLLV